MSPEQFRGEATAVSDLYSVGAVMLFLLTGRSPSEFPRVPIPLQVLLLGPISCLLLCVGAVASLHARQKLEPISKSTEYGAFGPVVGGFLEGKITLNIWP